MKLWQKGLIVLVVGVVLSAIFMNTGVQGLLREFARLISLVGIVLLVYGLVKRKCCIKTAAIKNH